MQKYMTRFNLGFVVLLVTSILSLTIIYASTSLSAAAYQDLNQTSLNNSCTPTSSNVLSNPGFESGNNNWAFFTNGKGSFSTEGPAFQCNSAAKLTITQTGNNMQFYQSNFSLKANTNYRLSFSAKSSTGDDLRVFLHQHKAPNTSYGLATNAVKLSTDWQTFNFDFKTTGFSGTTSDTRLRFWFTRLAQNGDIYWIDDVVLEEVGGSPPPPPPTATPGSAPNPTATPISGGGGGGKNELLVFDWNKIVTEKERGFPSDQPPMANGDWTKPVNFAEGKLYYRAEIRSQPVAQNMKLQFCFWQEKNGDKFALETCGSQGSVRGISGNVVTWSENIQDMWKKGNKPLEWQRARFRNGLAIKNSSGLPVSNYNNWNWNGENPKLWYPLNMRFTVVVVAKGATFSGWNNYK